MSKEAISRLIKQYPGARVIKARRPIRPGTGEDNIFFWAQWFYGFQLTSQDPSTLSSQLIFLWQSFEVPVPPENTVLDNSNLIAVVAADSVQTEGKGFTFNNLIDTLGPAGPTPTSVPITGVVNPIISNLSVQLSNPNALNIQIKLTGSSGVNKALFTWNVGGGTISGPYGTWALQFVSPVIVEFEY
jgi:hypothetical protein